MKKQINEQDDRNSNKKIFSVDREYRRDTERDSRKQYSMGCTEQSEVRIPESHQAFEATSDRKGNKQPQQLSLW
jgi:hypothetical protein